MPQQINIFTPVLATQNRYFSANRLVQVLTIVIFFSSGIYSYLIWEMGIATRELKNTFSLKAQELDRLHLAIKKDQQTRASGTVFVQAQSQRTELLRLEKIVNALQQGLSHNGQGHASRLELLSQTIPANVWITQISDEEGQIQISGLTFNPVLLKMWIDELAKNPLLEGSVLQTVKVESVRGESPAVIRPTWSFSFSIAINKPVHSVETKR